MWASTVNFAFGMKTGASGSKPEGPCSTTQRGAIGEALAGGWSALGVGMLIGLSTSFADRALRKGPRMALGKLASSPAQIDRRGWWAIIRRTFAEFSDDRVSLVAAGSTFFALLALFPALGVFV